MRTIERHVTYPGRGEWLTLYPLFDLHLGTRRCNEAKLQNVIDLIAADPAALWIGGGDYAEFINRSDPRHKESDMAAWLHGVDDLARAQVERVRDYLGPIAPKCIGILSGNHEHQMLRHCERNVYAEVLHCIKDASGHTDPLGLGFRGFIRLRCHRSTRSVTTLTLFCEHGWGGGRMRGANALQCDRIFQDVAADVYLAGHRHRAHVQPHTMAVVQGGQARNAMRLAAMVGTFRESDTPHDETDPGDYGDMCGYPPCDVAGVRIRFQPDAFRLTGEVFSY